MKTNEFKTNNPKTNLPIDTLFHDASIEEINRVCASANHAFLTYRRCTQQQRAEFLEQIIVELDNVKEQIIQACMLETALDYARLEGEFGRTTGQIKLFSTLLQKGSWVNAIIDSADPERKPIPKTDIRQMSVPLGPVAVFGASNFPLAFSVAGGDTISALAAGCTVVVKIHPEHPQTSTIVGNSIKRAVKKAGLPEGVFHFVHGKSHEVSHALVQHPQISAVGFTGSFRVGKILFDLANKREHPIPVFAEMGSVNPIVILPDALKNKPNELAQGLANSLTLGVGQFCTNPGIVFVANTEGKERFGQTLKELIANCDSGTMLSSIIHAHYTNSIEHLSSLENLKVLASGKSSNQPNAGCPIVFETSYNQFVKDQQLKQEVFGPSTILVWTPKEKLTEVACNFSGELTATVHGSETDFTNYGALLKSFEYVVGRIVINGFPTGVEVGNAMNHGGPFPATTHVQSTSVGSESIKRFVRPICFQNFPDKLLPDELKNDNPLGIIRKLNGMFTNSKVD